MDELIKSFRLGVVQIFGIMLPGLALLASLSYLLCLMKGAWVNGACNYSLMADWRSYRIEVAAGVMTLAYILGFIIRLMPMEWLDFPSKWWSNMCLWFWGRRGKKKDKWVRGSYPYANLGTALQNDGLSRLATLWENATSDPKNGEPVRAQINRLKLLVASQKPILASALTSSEANIRMMFGIFVAGAAALLVLLYGHLANWTQASCCLLVHGFWPLVVIIGCSLFLILHTFNHTRYNELVKLLTALEMCAATPKSVVNRVFPTLSASQPTKDETGNGGPSKKA